MKKVLLTLIFALALSGAVLAQSKTTIAFAHREDVSLFMDFYSPAPQLDSAGRPLILFMFGGGFKSGARDDEFNIPWFKALTDKGFYVVSIDYRLGLKDTRKKSLFKFADDLSLAVGMAVEDLFSATNYILEHGGEFGIGDRPIIISGSSAGAFTALQAEWEICSGQERAKVLPAGFNYAGVMSFSGAVLSRQGKIKYDKEPCPQMLMHGCEDRIVPYGTISFFNLWYGGSFSLAKVLEKRGANYQVLRYKDHGHEIAASLMENLERELYFIDHNVLKGEKIVVDACIDDPAIGFPAWGFSKTDDLYK